MGRMKEIWMENEQAISVLSFLEQKLNTASHGFIGNNPRIARILNLIGEIVFLLSKSPTYNRPLLDIINEEINEKAKELSESMEKKIIILI